MLNIGQFFKKIQGKYAKEIFVRSVVREAVKKHTQIDIAEEQIIFKNDLAYLGGLSSTARSQIFIKKQDILKEINTQQTVRMISDIK